jgi:putative hydrolase of the HAD superfamily
MRFADVDAVTLDCLRTLVELEDPVPTLAAALRARGAARDADTVRAAFRAEVAYYREHLGEGRDAASLHELRVRCTAVFLHACDAEVDPDEFAHAFREALRFRVLPGVVEALASLRARGLELAVVSNWDIGLHEWLAELGLRSLLSDAATSAEAGVEKPDPAIFHLTLQRLGVTADRALHIGDGDTDRDGAATGGLAFERAPLAEAVRRWS